MFSNDNFLKMIFMLFIYNNVFKLDVVHVFQEEREEHMHSLHTPTTLCSIADHVSARLFIDHPSSMDQIISETEINQMIIWAYSTNE